MADRSISRSRRYFLLAAGAGGLGAAIATKTAPAKKPAAAGEVRTARAGYRRTAHIGNYYRTAKF